MSNNGAPPWWARPYEEFFRRTLVSSAHFLMMTALFLLAVVFEVRLITLRWHVLPARVRVFFVIIVVLSFIPWISAAVLHSRLRPFVDTLQTPVPRARLSVGGLVAASVLTVATMTYFLVLVILFIYATSA